MEFNRKSCMKCRLLIRFKLLTTQGTETHITLHYVTGLENTLASSLLRFVAQTPCVSKQKASKGVIYIRIEFIDKRNILKKAISYL